MAVDIAAIREKLKMISEGRSKSGGGMNAWRPEIGEYKIRCLPWPDAEAGQPFHERAFYYFGDNRLLAPFQFSARDPVKEMRDKLFSTKKEDDKTLAKRLLPKVRAYIPVIVRGKESEGVKIWSVGKEIHARLLGFFCDSDIGDFLDLQDGYDLKVTISRAPGKKFNDTSVDASRKPSVAMSSKKEIDDLLKQIPRLDDIYKQKPYDECKRMLDQWINDGAPGDQGYGTERGEKQDDEATKSDKSASEAKPANKSQKTLDELENMFKDSQR